jgi:hypothetical protein
MKPTDWLQQDPMPSSSSMVDMEPMAAAPPMHSGSGSEMASPSMMFSRRSSC